MRSRGRPPHDDILTPSEWRVVHGIQHGMTNREIAQRRGISLDAVKFHVANVVAKLGVRNRKALRQWFRAPRHSALDREDSIVETSLSLGRIGQIARSVKDIAQSEAWYRDVLGLPHIFTYGKLAFFDCGGTRLMLTQEQSVSAESVLYLWVDNIKAAHEELAARGVVFTHPPHMIHRHADGCEEWMAFFADGEGRPLGIMSKINATAVER